MKPTDQHKEFIWKKFEEGCSDIKPLTSAFVDHFFSDEPENMKDGRSKYGRLVKAALVERGLKAKASHQYQPKEKTKLSEEDAEFIDNHYRMMSFVEIARLLFDDSNLSNLSPEARSVQEYIQSLSPEEGFRAGEIPQEEYKPPRSVDRAIAKVNKYILEGIDRSKITAANKKNCEMLIRYLHTFRFLHHMNHLSTNVDRELYESSFVRYTHDKPDLSHEEIDQYIVLSGEAVIASNIQRRVEHLQGLLDDAANDSEGRRISMALVESINTAQNEYHQSVNRQHKLLDDLKEKRSSRLKNQQKDNASILNLVEIWRDEEGRKKMIALAEMRKDVLSEEINNISNMDEIRARVLGLTEEEVLEG
jgi:hypothetical protein|tara:strand:+ start:387 stop:1475 length:1089 start_codon:yes stop_codon:yes gene_type:complete